MALVALAAVVLWGVSGFFQVAPDELGLVMRFGQYVRDAKPPHLFSTSRHECREKVALLQMREYDCQEPPLVLLASFMQVTIESAPQIARAIACEIVRCQLLLHSNPRIGCATARLGQALAKRATFHGSEFAIRLAG
jgi:hypothetical protein